MVGRECVGVGVWGLCTEFPHILTHSRTRMLSTGNVDVTFGHPIAIGFATIFNPDSYKFVV